MFASVLIWKTVVTSTQLAGYTVATIGLLHYSFGVDSVRSFIRDCAFQMVHRDDNNIARSRRVSRLAVGMILTVAVLVGSFGGVLAAYRVQMDPRAY